MQKGEIFITARDQYSCPTRFEVRYHGIQREIPLEEALRHGLVHGQRIDFITNPDGKTAQIQNVPTVFERRRL